MKNHRSWLQNRLAFLGLLILCSGDLFAQSPTPITAFTPAKPALAVQTFSGKASNPFLPDMRFRPIPLRVNLIIIQREDGSGNFQDNAADREFLERVMYVTNQTYSNLQDRNEEYFPGQNLLFLQQAKVQFLPKIIFVRDEKGWNNRNDTNFAGVPNLSGWYLNALDQQICASDTLQKSINLYFTTDGQLYEEMVVSGSTTDYDHRVFFKQHAASEVPYVQTKSRQLASYHTMRCHIGNVWLKLWWKRNVLHEPDWTMEGEVGKSIAHELGHLMGLDHTADQQTHALMRTRFGGQRDYLSAKEIAKIHQTIGLYPSLWQFVPEDFTYGISEADWVVSDSAHWEGNRRLFANIVVQPGAKLEISGEVLLPANGEVQLGKGAILVLKNGILRRVNTPAEKLVSMEKLQKNTRKPAKPMKFRSKLGGKLQGKENSWLDPALLGLKARK